MDQQFQAQSPTLVGGREGESGMMGALSRGMDKAKMVSSFMGDNEQERIANLKAFTALTKDIGGVTTALSQSTLMDRIMKEGTKPMTTMGGEGGPSGGIAAIPKTFDPAMAQGIMSRLGFK